MNGKTQAIKEAEWIIQQVEVGGICESSKMAEQYHEAKKLGDGYKEFMADQATGQVDDDLYQEEHQCVDEQSDLYDDEAQGEWR